MLIQRKAEQVFLVSDHGASRLAVINDHENKWEMASKGEHSGRCCLMNEIDEAPLAATKEERDNFYWVLANYDRFKGGRMADIEVHGGASLEEALIPIIRFELSDKSIDCHIMGESVIIESLEGNPVIPLSCNDPNATLSLIVKGTPYQAIQDESKLVTDHEHVKMLAKISVDINVLKGEVSFELPDFGLSSRETIIEDYVWNQVKDDLVTGQDVWGMIELGYRDPDDSARPKIPGKIKLVNFQNFCPYSIDLDFYKDVRDHFSTEEWLDVLLGAIDYNAAGYHTEEEKLTMLTRLLPFVEKRLNLIELAPKGTGKSYLFGRVSRYGFIFSVKHLASVVDSIEQYDRDMDGNALVTVEPPSIDQRIVNQYSFFTVLPSGITNLQTYLDENTVNTVKYVIDKSLRWDLRDILDQLNMNERMIYPGADGIAKWLARHYYFKR